MNWTTCPLWNANCAVTAHAAATAAPVATTAHVAREARRTVTSSATSAGSPNHHPAPAGRSGKPASAVPIAAAWISTPSVAADTLVR